MTCDDCLYGFFEPNLSRGSCAFPREKRLTLIKSIVPLSVDLDDIEKTLYPGLIISRAWADCPQWITRLLKG